MVSSSLIWRISRAKQGRAWLLESRMHGNVQVSVRRGGVGVPEQSGPSLLPDSFR